MRNLAIERLACALSLAVLTTFPAVADVTATDVLVDVGEERVTVAAFRAELLEKWEELRGRFDRSDSGERAEAIDRLVQRRLFYFGGLEEIPEASAIADSVRAHEELRATWLSLKRRLHPGEEALTPEAIARFREQRAAAWHGRQILVNTREDLDEVVERLEAGEDFGAIAMELSLDEGSAAIGGQLYPFRYGDWYPQIIDLAFSLHPGTYGGPVESRLGFHMLKCDSVLYEPEHPEVFTYYEMRRRRTRMDEFNGIDSVLTVHVERLGIEVVPEAVDEVLDHLLPNGNPTLPPRPAPGWDIPETAAAKSAQGDTMTVAEFYEGFDVLRGYDWPIPGNRRGIESAIERLMVAYVLRREYRAGEYALNPVNAARVDAVVHRTVGQLFFDRVLDPGPIDSVRAEQVFEEHPEAFLIPEQASVGMLGVSSAAFADTIEAWIADGMSFREAGERIQLIDEAAWYNRPTPLYPRGRFPEHDQLVFEDLEVGGVSERDATSRGYQFFYLARREPERPASRLEVNVDVLTSRGRAFLLQQAREVAERRLRDEHPVVRHEALIEEVVTNAS